MESELGADFCSFHGAKAAKVDLFGNPVQLWPVLKTHTKIVSD